VTRASRPCYGEDHGRDARVTMSEGPYVAAAAIQGWKPYGTLGAGNVRGVLVGIKRLSMASYGATVLEKLSLLLSY